MAKRISVLLAVFLLASAAHTQQGIPPFGSFHANGFDVVNRQNLNAHFTIPIASSAARGFPFTYVLSYNSMVWKRSLWSTWVPETSGGPTPTWGWLQTQRVGFLEHSISTDECWPPDPWTQPIGTMTTYHSYRYTDEAGTRHPFFISFTEFDPPSYEEYCGTGFEEREGYAIDNSGIYLDLTSGSEELTAKDGTDLAVTSMKDSNGNYVSMVVVSANERHWKDTTGRVAVKVIKRTSCEGGFPECTDYVHKSADGTDRTATLYYSSFNVKTAFNCSGVGEYNQTGKLLPARLKLANGQSYDFAYEPTPGDPTKTTARLKSVTLPTGGIVEYTLSGVNCADGSAMNLTKTFKIGATPVGTWQFARSQINATTWRTKVTPPTLPYHSTPNESVFTFTSGRESSAQFYQGPESGGTLLRTVNTAWAGNGTPASTTTILNDTNQQSKVETAFNDFGNLTQQKEYDWGSGSVGGLVRTTTLAYLATIPYTSANILDRVTSVTLQDGQANIKAKTEIFYDEPGWINVECPANVPQHDDSTHGCSNTTRGNPTTIRQWVNGSQYIHNSPKYDSLGNVLSITDTASHVTTFNYADSWSGPCSVPAGARAYPKTVTNHLGHSTTFVYNNCTGAVVSATDPNNQTTSFAYDWAGRPLQTNRPDGGQTLWHYEDASRYVRMKTLRAAGAYVVNYAYFDALGRLFRQALCEDGTDTCASPVMVDLTYDAFGRQATVTNPYRSTSDPTYGVTETRYDALGRVTKVIPPDGTATSNNVVTSYSGNMTTLTDQQGKQRRSWTDASGRLIQVNEPGGTPPSLATPARTKYYYDALDNLTKVEQMGYDPVNPTFWRIRTFTYDWLSRLLTANHPESGTTTYVYQGSGTDSLLQTITDARGITTTYSYDALHRLTQKTYSDGTAMARYFYDQNVYWGAPLQNTVGRLIWFEAGNTGTQISYDALGRVARQWQCNANCSVAYQIDSAYDSTGNLTSLAHPSGRKVTYGYNSASQLNRVTFDSFNGTPVGYNYLSSATYHPHGAPDSLTLGNGLAQKLVYNNRMQPCRMNLKSGGAVTLSCTDGAPSGNLADFKYGFNHGTANSGSVVSWIGQGPAITDFNRNFTYDELNRLKTMTGAVGACTGLEWIYDIWGNRDEQRVTGGTCPTHNPTILTNNRIAELSYDAAGNVTADGSFTYQWDAESRLKSLNTTGAVYTYDAAGMRVRKAVGSNSTEYIYFNGQVIAERSGGGTWTDYIHAGTKLIARSDPIVVRFTNDSCSGCGGQPGGDRNLFINSVTVGSTTIYPTDSSVSYTAAPCNRTEGGVGWLLCNGDMVIATAAAGSSVTVNAYGSPDLGVYPHMQVWVNGNLVGEWDVTGTAQNYTVPSTIPGVQYYHGDHLGSTRVVTNGNGEVLWSYDYMPFGEGATADNLVNRLFTGHERDAESGLDHTWFRKYSSAQGRWLSPDPLAGSVTDPQSLNRYAYVLNDPVNFIDPLGLCTWEGGYVDSSGTYIHANICVVDGGGGGGGGGGFLPPGGCISVYLDGIYLGNTCEPTGPIGGDGVGPGGDGSAGGSGSPTQKSGTSLVSKVVNAVCSVVPDATSVSGGFDVGNGYAAGGAQAGWVFNGRSGQATWFLSLVGSGGLIGTDAYVSAGVIPNAPDNSGLRGWGKSAAGGAGRVGGIASTPGHYQVTAGASTNVVTSAVQASYTPLAIDIPFLGYVANWPRAACKAATGQ